MVSSMAKTPLSIGAPTPWPSSSPSSSSPPSKAYTYNSNYDCSLSICSVNCPQFCSILVAPPPPLFLNPDGGVGDDDSSSRISPLMAALIAVLAAFFLLLFYFTIISKLCRRRRNRRLTEARFLDPETSGRIDSFIHDPARHNTNNESGLDDTFIRQITVFKFRREDKLVEGTECAVCLTEFNENENLRLMPNCEHAFHLPCIDPWLKIHSNCPVCRSTMLNPAPAPNPNRSGTGSAGSGGNNSASVAALRVQSSNDAVLVVRELESQVQVLEAAPGDEVGSRVCRNHTVEDNNNNNNNNNNNRESKLENHNNNSR